MTGYVLSELEEYNSDKFIAKKICDGVQSKAMLLHLGPGQEVPVHPHAQSEVYLLPQKGEAALFRTGEVNAPLRPGMLFYAGAEPVFGVRNTGATPFQTVVLLVRIGAGS